MLGGVIFNRIGGESHNHWLKEAVQSSGLDVAVLGGVPKVQHWELRAPTLPCLLVYELCPHETLPVLPTRSLYNRASLGGK